MPSSLEVPLAWKSLTSSRVRLTASSAGIAFAVALMFTQNGFRNALMDSMANVILHLDGDLMLIGRTQYTQFVPQPFPRRRVEQALSVEGVASAVPMYAESRLLRWRNPTNGQERRIRVLAYPPEEKIFDIPEVYEQRDLWRQPDTALADELSQMDKYGQLQLGTVSELGGRQIRIVGEFSLGTDFQNHGNLIVTEENFLKLMPHRRGQSLGERAVDVGVLKVSPGTDLIAVQRELQDRLPSDIRVLTKQQYVDREQGFWGRVTPIGTVFNIGVVMGFVVGLGVCYQVLFTEISDHLAEFATLKAMGHSNRSLTAVVLEEAFLLSLFGFAVGVVVSIALFWVIRDATGLPLELKWVDAAMIYAFTLMMCLASGWFAARRLHTADPASLFQ